MRMYEKFSTFLRLEALSNNLKDFGLNKGLDNLDKVRRMLGAVTDRFAAFEAQALDVHVDFPLFQRLTLPIPRGLTLRALPSTRLRPSGQQPLPTTPHSNRRTNVQTRSCLSKSQPLPRPSHPTVGCLNTSQSKTQILRLIAQESNESRPIRENL